jgi:hypothetical protein
VAILANFIKTIVWHGMGTPLSLGKRTTALCHLCFITVTIPHLSDAITDAAPVGHGHTSISKGDDPLAVHAKQDCETVKSGPVLYGEKRADGSENSKAP